MIAAERGMDENFLNAVTELVTARRCEEFPSVVLAKPMGQWIRVTPVCRELGLEIADLNSELFAAWMNDPGGNDGYALIVFFHPESFWTMGALYNRDRLSRGS